MAMERFGHLHAVALCGLMLLVACSNPEAAPADAGADSGADSAPHDLNLASCPSVITTSGKVQGIASPSEQSCSFKGIPFAKPPVGTLRWQPPQKPAPWSDTFMASTYGSACPQATTKWKGEGELDEDCLTLNVWAPADTPSTPAPVLVWIHKGYWNQTGSSVTVWSDGTNLAEKEGLVVVSFHYRLGALGFLAHPALGADSGNYGFLDQVAALKWVQENIAAFGGDPANVTIMGGGSQGAEMVGVHLVSKASTGLFHRAIIHSGILGANSKPPSPFAGRPYLSRADAEAQGQELAAAPTIACDTASDVADCLRQKAPDALNSALPAISFSPKIGATASWAPIVEPNGVLEGEPLVLIATGKLVNKVPVLLGANKLEAGFQFHVGYDDMTDQSLIDRWKLMVGDTKAAALENEYLQPPPSPLGSCQSACAAACYQSSDMWFICPARRTARALASQGVSTYLYHLTYPVWQTLNAAEQTGAGHGTIKVYVFDTPQQSPPPPHSWPAWPFAPEEEAMAKQIMGYWARFARTGDPNGGSAVQWPRYEEASDQHLELGATIKVGSKLHESACDIWDGL